MYYQDASIRLEQTIYDPEYTDETGHWFRGNPNIEIKMGYTPRKYFRLEIYLGDFTAPALRLIKTKRSLGGFQKVIFNPENRRKFWKALFKDPEALEIIHHYHLENLENVLC